MLISCTLKQLRCLSKTIFFPGKVISSSVRVPASLVHFLTEWHPCKEQN